MPEYKFVNVRFNTENEDENLLFSKLNPNNKGGSIKKFLKQYFLLEDGNIFKKAQIESLIKEMVINMVNENNIKSDSNIKEIKKIESKGIKIIVKGNEKVYGKF